MDTLRISAVLLIASAATVMLAAAIIPPGLYQTPDIDERLQIIEAHRTLWLSGTALFVLYAALTIVGFSLLAYAMWTGGQGWISVLGAIAIVAGTVLGMYFVYLQTIDPRGGYSGAYPTPENLAYWLWLAGALIFGVAFLQSDLPNWLGFVTAGAAAVYSIVFLITGFGAITPWILGFLSLVIGIVLLRQ
jgi:hypothetical protein